MSAVDAAHLLAMSGAAHSALPSHSLIVTKTPEHKAPAAPITTALNSTKHGASSMLDSLATPAAKKSRHEKGDKTELRHKDAEQEKIAAPKASEASFTAPTAQVQNTQRTEQVAAPAPVMHVAQVLPPSVLEDPTLRIVMMPNVARVHLTTADAGQVSIEVKVKDGVTDVRATGSVAPIMAAHQSELRVSLAKEGLAMGHFDMTQSNHQSHQRPEDERAAREISSPRPVVNRSTQTHDEDGFHVKA